MIRDSVVIGLAAALLTGCSPKTVRSEVSTAEDQKHEYIETVCRLKTEFELRNLR